MKPPLQALLAYLLPSTTAKRHHTSTLIPFQPTNDSIPFTSYQLLNFHFSPNASSKLYTPFLDTGSTGTVISAIDIPEWSAEIASNYPVGWEYLSSSKRLYTGNWIPKDIYFNLLEDNNESYEVIHVQVPVLCVTRVSICNGSTKYNSTRDEGNCPRDGNGYLPPVTEFPTGIRILGVGWDRMGDGMPQGGPDKNVFLNVKGIGGWLSRGFKMGYIVTKEGVRIGLTEESLEGMEYVNLKRISEKMYDWGAVPACMFVDGAGCVMGTALLDTGLSNSYITLPGNASVKTVPNTNLLVDGSRVKIDFGVAVDEFVVGENVTEGVTPTKVAVTLNDARVPFVNTGRHVYRYWEVAFDAVEGKVGFRPAS